MPLGVVFKISIVNSGFEDASQKQNRHGMRQPEEQRRVRCRRSLSEGAGGKQSRLVRLQVRLDEGRSSNLKEAASRSTERPGPRGAAGAIFLESTFNRLRAPY